MNRQSSPSTIPGRGARRGLLALALALMTILALAFSFRAAEAAPPEVTTPDEPVVIPFGQNTKAITLTWSLPPGTRSPAKLVVTDPAVVLDQGVSCPPCMGNVPLTVTYGKTYTAQLYDALTNLELGLPLTIHTARPKPTLTVRPAPPICVNEPGQKVQVGVAYTLDGQPTAHLLVTDDTAMVKVVDVDVSGSGSKSFNAEYNHSYTAHLLLPPANTMDLLPPVKITTKDCGDGPKDPPPCTETRDCPTLKWAIDPHGTYARFEVTPSQPAFLLIEVSTSPPVNGEFASLDAIAASNAVVSSTWTANLVGNGLKAATHYYCLIRANPQETNEVIQPCEFTTLTRVVNVTFNSLTIWDDSDDGDGELTFNLSINGNQVHHFFGTYDEVYTVTFNGGFAVSPSDPKVTLTVFGWDDDAGPLDSCAGWDLFTHPFGGDEACAEWFTVEQTFIFPTGLGEVWSINENMKTYNGLPNVWPLSFDVSVSVSVDYKKL